jgi:hypothetical protein
MRMPSTTVVHGHLQSWTASYRRFTVALVAPSMEVDIRTHGIIHLENHVETQDAELEETAYQWNHPP